MKIKKVLLRCLIILIFLIFGWYFWIPPVWQCKSDARGVCDCAGIMLDGNQGNQCLGEKSYSMMPGYYGHSVCGDLITDKQLRKFICILDDHE